MHYFLLFLLLNISICQALEIHGHRGARARFPENTIPAFEYALSLPVDVLELDLRASKDGKLFVSHDAHINPEICRDSDHARISVDHPPLILSLTSAEIRRYDCGSLPNPKFPDQTLLPGTVIPELEDVFELVKLSKHASAKKVKFNIELKSDPKEPTDTLPPRELANLGVSAFRKSGLLDRIILQSFDPRVLVEARKMAPELKRSLLIEDEALDWDALLKETGATILSPLHTLLTKEKIAHFHSKKIQVIPWTVNDPKDQRKLIQWKVDGIISDDPKTLVQAEKRDRF